jgi:hypothetical protein
MSWIVCLQNWLLKYGLVNLWNNIKWNISNITNFKGINLSLFLWLNKMRIFNLCLICLPNWNKSNSFNNNMSQISIFHWHVMISINLNNRIWSCNFFLFWSENMCDILRNSFNWNISNVSNFESWNRSRNSSFYRNQFWCIWWSRINWNVFFTIKC